MAKLTLFALKMFYIQIQYTIVQIFPVSKSCHNIFFYMGQKVSPKNVRSSDLDQVHQLFTIYFNLLFAWFSKKLKIKGSYYMP